MTVGTWNAMEMAHLKTTMSPQGYKALLTMMESDQNRTELVSEVAEKSIAIMDQPSPTTQAKIQAAVEDFLGSSKAALLNLFN